MKIQELKEILSQNNKIIINELIKVKLYVSSIEKKLLVDNIINGCIELDENYIMKIDYFNKNLVKDISIIANYTDLEFSEDDSIAEYDYLIQNDIFDYIIENINEKEIEFINDLLYDELKQKIDLNNSLTNVIVKTLNNLISKIPDEKSLNKMMSNMTKNLNKIKPENLNMMKDLFSQNKGQNFMSELSKNIVKNDGIEVTD